jgi:hypothetical protein
MDKKMAGLLGAAALVTINSTPASASRLAEPATTYRDLLESIPDALALLKADDAARAQQKPDNVQLAQYYHHHHHHHHHHGYDAGAAIVGGVIGGIIGSQPGYYGPPPGNCYWTLGRPYWDGYAWVRPRVRVCE